MKKARMVICLVVVVVMFSASYTKASGLVFQSQQYSVGGQYNYRVDTEYSPPLTFGDDYNLTSESPVSGSVFYSSNLYNSSSADLLSVSEYANSEMLSSGASGFAEGDWIFSPQAEGYSLDMEFDYHLWMGGSPGFPERMEVLLEEVGTGQQIFKYWAGNGSVYYQGVQVSREWGIFNATVSLDPARQYHMHAYVRAVSPCECLYYGSFTTTVVPEPATISLFVFGGLLLRRKK